MTTPPGDVPAEPNPDDAAQQAELPAWARLHLWEIAALRDLALVAAFVGVIWLFVWLRAVSVPIAVGFLLASLCHPLVSGARRRFGWPRWLTTMLAVLVLLGIAVAFALRGLPLLLLALRDFARALPDYVRTVLETLELDGGGIVRQLESFEVSLIEAGPLLTRAMALLGVAADVFGVFAYAVIAGVFMLVTFVWMTVHFDRLPSVQRFLPASRREQVWSVLYRFEKVFGGYVRGQMLVALFTTSGFAVGFTLLGVPHAPVAAMVGGVFSFVPNGQASGWLLAMLFSALGAPSADGFPWLAVIVGPTSVYAVTQSLETFLVTPFVQGSYTRLHPLAVLGSLIGGAAVGGIAGVLLAIPVTACAWIVMRELLAPAVEQLAAER